MRKQVAKTVALWAWTVFACWVAWDFVMHEQALEAVQKPAVVAIAVLFIGFTVYESTILVVALVMRSLMSNGWTPAQQSDWVDELLDPNNDYVVVPAPYDTEYHIYWLPSAGGKGGCWVGEFWMLDDNIQCVDRTMDLEKEQVVTWFVNHALTQFPE